MLTYVKPIKKLKPKQTVKTSPLRISKPKSFISSVSFLQQIIGNQTVIRMMEDVHNPLSVVGGQIQAKLKIGQPNDKYEQEADRVAEKIMIMPASTCTSCEEEERLQPKLADEISPFVQPQETEEEEEVIQPKRVTNNKTKVTLETENYIVRTRGLGNPLPYPTRAFMEERFGLDFGPVRIHADSEAARMARALNAEAFTYGRDIYFGEGKYRPETTEGKKLLAHELTHVVQQRGGTQTAIIGKHSFQDRKNTKITSSSMLRVQLRTIDGDFEKCKNEAGDRKDLCLARGATLCGILGTRLPLKAPKQVGIGGVCFYFYTKACQKTYWNDISFCKRKRNCLKEGIEYRKTPNDCEGWFKGWIKGGSGDPWPDFERFKDWYDDWGKKPKIWPPKVKLKHWLYYFGKIKPPRGPGIY